MARVTQNPAGSEKIKPFSHPAVSVVITVWNGERYLAEAIESVRSQQTAVPWELIVVDDGSTDSSYRISRSYADREPWRVRVLTHCDGANHGISASRNLGIAAARAAVLAFLDADDVWLPHRIEHQFALFAASPAAAMIYGAAERWYDFERAFEGNNPSGSRNFVPPLIPADAHPGLLRPPLPLPWFLADESMTPCTCTVLVRTEVARKLGGFDCSFRGLYDDQVFYAKLALEEPVLVDLECVARYRQHADSCCRRASAGNEHAAARQNFLGWLSDYIESKNLTTPAR